MKKHFFVFTLLVLLFTNVSIAQSEDHLAFKGVSINGSLTTFVEKMKSVGFTFDSYISDNSIAVMNGKFAGVEASIYIGSSPKTKTVFKVLVYFGKQSSWQSLKSDYYKYVAAMTEKYGEPSDHYEFFSKPYYEGDGYELQALRHDKCNYISFYEIENGTIVVQMTSAGEISIGYEDAVNIKVNSSERNSVIQSDL